MRRFQAIGLTRMERGLRWAMLCLMLTWVTGCQAMMMMSKAKAKEQTPSDKFSCGEKMPARIP